LDEKAYDEALKQLEVEPCTGNFRCTLSGIEGRCPGCPGQKVEARAAYKAAQEKAMGKPGAAANCCSRNLTAWARRPDVAPACCSFRAASLLLAGCATFRILDSINPFSSAGPKMAPLKPFTATAEVRRNGLSAPARR
jgi:hypothetical protein